MGGKPKKWCIRVCFWRYGGILGRGPPPASFGSSRLARLDQKAGLFAGPPVLHDSKPTLILSRPFQQSRPRTYFQLELWSPFLGLKCSCLAMLRVAVAARNAIEIEAATRGCPRPWSLPWAGTRLRGSEYVRDRHFRTRASDCGYSATHCEGQGHELV